MMNVEQIVDKYIARNQLLDNEGKYIVALSGGADSVALLLILSHLGYDVCAAHCNFHLRGEESDRDELFCVDLCNQFNISLHRIHFDTQTYAAKYKASIEMAARDLRYNYFAQLCKDIGANGICVAHHRNDNVETVILNLLRGSGVEGLAGIAPKNGNIVRPLLCICREDILGYLATQHQSYVTDSTNLEDDALRNKIRHHVIPLLKTINPAASDNIARSAKYLRQAALMLDNNLAETQDQTTYIRKEDVMNAASPEFVLHHLLGKYGFHGDIIDDIIERICQVGKKWQSKTHIITVDRDRLLVAPIAHIQQLADEKAVSIPEDGNYKIGERQKIKLRIYPRPANFKPSKDIHCVTLDAGKVDFPLTYRLSRQGDRFCPFGMKGTKLVSDYLTDRKRNTLEKASQHVMTDKQGEIVWLVGERTSEKCKIDENTQEILEISITREE